MNQRLARLAAQGDQDAILLLRRHQARRNTLLIPCADHEAWEEARWTGGQEGGGLGGGFGHMVTLDHYSGDGDINGGRFGDGRGDGSHFDDDDDGDGDGDGHAYRFGSNQGDGEGIGW